MVAKMVHNSKMDDDSRRAYSNNSLHVFRGFCVVASVLYFV